MKISIQGNLGSYSHIAAVNIFGKEIELLERDTFKEVFEDLKENRADYIVIPIENSTHGSIYQNFDLMTEYNFHIINEIYLIINFHLIALPGVEIKDLKDVYTHPVAMAQIRSFLEEHPTIDPHEYPDTAGALKMIKEKNLMNAAGSASRFAAELYGMNVLKEKIQHNKKNYTRFFVLSHNNLEVENAELEHEGLTPNEHKTTIQFELGEEAGSLYNALGFFHKRNISLTKIESRPILNSDWEYRFYLDFKAGLDKNMQEAIKELKYLVRDFRILGSYKVGKYIET